MEKNGARIGALGYHEEDKMARVTRLELAASAVTGRRSNQLSYTRAWVNEAYIIKAPPTCQRRFLCLREKNFVQPYQSG